MDGNAIFRFISGWEAAGLIDADTAERLRMEVDKDEAGRTAVWSARRSDGIGAAIGPAVSAGEVLAYVGAGFLLMAIYAFAGTLAAGGLSWSAAHTVIVVVLTGFGVVLATRTASMRRAAGAAFAVAAVHAGLAVQSLRDPVFPAIDPSQFAIAAGLAIAAAGALYRRYLPALATQAGVLIGVGVTVYFMDSAIEAAIYRPDFGTSSFVVPVGAVAMRAAAGLAAWFAAAVLLDRLASVEQRASSADADRRTALTRFAAGLTAVIGAALVFGSNRFAVSWAPGGIYQQWMGEVGIVAVSLVLLAVAMRRGSTVYVYPAALGLVISLSEFNSDYVVSQTGIAGALLLEGAVLIGAGAAADRVRRQVRARRSGSPTAAALAA